MISSVVVSELLGKSDHVVLNFEYTCYSSTPVLNYNYCYLFHKGDYESMVEDLSKMTGTCCSRIWILLKCGVFH